MFTLVTQIIFENPKDFVKLGSVCSLTTSFEAGQSKSVFGKITQIWGYSWCTLRGIHN